MKKATIFYILSFFTIFLSVSNLVPELSFRTTDSDAYSLFKVKEEKSTVSVKKTTLKTVAGVKTATTAKTSTPVKTATSNTGRHFDYTNKSYINRGIGNVVLKEAGNSIAIYRFCSSCTPFLYAHNTANLFKNLANMRRGDTFSVKIYGVTKTYRVYNNIVLDLSILNPSKDKSDDFKERAANLRKSLYTSTYGGKYDITMQTCAGKNDSQRRFIQAFEIK